MLVRGRRLPYFRLATMGGVSLSRDHWSNQTTLFYGWASWHPSRARLPLLQRFTRANIGAYRIVPIAFDVQGPELPMRYIRAAGGTFTPLIDVSCELSRLWGARSLPFALLVDRKGIVVRALDDVDEEFLLTGVPAEFERPELPFKGEPPIRHVHPPRFEIHMQYANNLLGRGRKDDAVAELRKALELDPKNRLVVPQMLAIAHPDRFYAGDIDLDWLDAQTKAARRRP